MLAQLAARNPLRPQQNRQNARAARAARRNVVRAPPPAAQKQTLKTKRKALAAKRKAEIQKIRNSYGNVWRLKKAALVPRHTKYVTNRETVCN